MAQQVPKRLRKIVKSAVEQGWTQDFTKNGYTRLLPPRGACTATGDLVAPVIFAKTPSDHRGDRNAIGALRRAGLDV